MPEPKFVTLPPDVKPGDRVRLTMILEGHVMLAGDPDNPTVRLLTDNGGIYTHFPAQTTTIEAL